MNYTLAKQLRDNGFPQGTPNFTDESRWTYYSPDLSSLIEACGTGFSSLHKLEPEWHVIGHMFFDNLHIGSTPEEAVANLFLALNKKK